MTVRAKMICQGVKKFIKWDGSAFIYEAEFTCVGCSVEDKAFFDATPSGSLRLATLRDDFFEPGKTYYIDITESGTEA